jgi:hypothetical protein
VGIVALSLIVTIAAVLSFVSLLLPRIDPAMLAAFD